MSFVIEMVVIGLAAVWLLLCGSNNFNAFGAINVDGEFTFYHQGHAFVLYDLDEVQVRDNNDEIIDVVNGKIRLS